MKIEKLRVGQVVYSVERRLMGNTTLSTVDVRKITITEIGPDNRWVMASCNGNVPRKYLERQTSKWRKKEPILYRYEPGTFGHRMGVKRLATRAEIKAMEDKQS
jgi:hypothetical protein